jgi:hypothetical protein
MMSQKDFTDYVIPKILERFPPFKDCCVYKPGDIVDIEINSSSRRLELWLTTQDIEITIGFTGADESLHDWHIHITTYGNETLDDDIYKASNIIDDIINDKEPICYSNIYGYAPLSIKSDSSPQEDEIIESRPWSKW